jgi:hypothetical protein
MKANINEDELKLLAYLHEHAEGYTEEFQLTPGEVAEEMQIEFKKFAKDASYLASFGLIGMNTIDNSSLDGRSYGFMGMWLTGHGENYMRELEQQPGIARKLTVGAVSELWEMGKGTIVAAAGRLLAEFAKHY